VYMTPPQQTITLIRAKTGVVGETLHSGSGASSSAAMAGRASVVAEECRLLRKRAFPFTEPAAVGIGIRNGGGEHVNFATRLGGCGHAPPVLCRHGALEWLSVVRAFGKPAELQRELFGNPAARVEGRGL